MLPRLHVTPGDTATLDVVAAVEATGPLVLEQFVGNGAPRRLLLTGEHTVGRGDASLVLDDTAASRVHASFHRVGAGVRIEDLGSRNGVFVDGRRIDGAVVVEGAIVRVGNALFRVVARDDVSVDEPSSLKSHLVGGAALDGARRQISLVAKTSLSVLLLGETGTGKDVAARWLHDSSERKGAFIAINCAGLPAELVESELFGHAKAAFTGAATARKGLFVAAHEGTLFLDEVGDLPLPAQAKLLRVLEDGIVRAVGADRGQRVDVRVVSATNRDLHASVQAGLFRADLLARLGQVEVRLPALRSRPEDLPKLIEHLARRAGAPLSVEIDAAEALALYAFPMNVRELDSLLRVALLGRKEKLGFGDLPEACRRLLTDRRKEKPTLPLRESPPPDPRVDAPDAAARLMKALEIHEGNVSRAAEAAGMSRVHAYRVIARNNLQVERFRPTKEGKRDLRTLPPAGGTTIAQGPDAPLDFTQEVKVESSP